MAAALSYTVLKPRWVLTYAKKDITADISDMVTEISYSDKAENFSDELELTVEDRDRRWQGPWFPVRGDLVGALIGYYGVGRLLDCGIFQVDELELKGPPDSFHLKCIAAGIKTSLRTPRSAGYESQTLTDVANTIAQRHGMTVTGTPQNINVTWDRITQRKETDLQFLHRLAIAHNYDFSIRNQQLVFYSRTALEQAASVGTILRTQVKSFEFKTRTQQIYKSASVAYQNPDQKQLISAQASDAAKPVADNLHQPTRIENPQQAQLKADGALHDNNKDEVTGRIEAEGTIVLVAGVNLDIQGFGQFDGKYHVTSSRHRLERSSGYVTEVEVRKLA